MHRAIHKSFLQKIHQLPAVMMVLGMLCAVTLACTSNVMVAYADGIPGGNVADPVVRAVDIAKPSVVRIFTEVSGQLTVNFSAINSVTFPQGGSKAYQAVLSGSGTFITANGDILTADHVVNPPADVLEQAAAQDISTYISSHSDTGLGQTSSDQVIQLLQSGQLKSSATFGPKKSEVFLSTDYTGPLSATNITQVPPPIQEPVDQIEKESAVNQDDVAIIHAPFVDTPAVQLGNSSNVQQQDQLNIIGFPGNGDVSNKPTDLLTSSVNTINVSSIKTTDAGAPVIQVGGNVEQGDSGGPALDMSGNVVGVVSFGVAATAGGTSFLQASNSALSLVQALKLNTTPGNFQKLWSQAFNDYSATVPGHWHKAAQELQQLTTTYPQFKAVSKYLNYAQAQAKSEKAITATPTSTPVATKSGKSLLPNMVALAETVGAILVVVLLVVVLFTVLLRQRGKNKQRKSGGVVAAVRPPAPPAAVRPGQGNGMVAFGAPTQHSPGVQVPGSPPSPPTQGMPSTSVSQQSTAPLRIWPCGHMNRSNARFCSICGEPAPEPPTSIRRVE